MAHRSYNNEKKTWPVQRYQFLQSIKDFFLEQGLLEVITPPISRCPTIDPHIHPTQLHAPTHNTTLPLYLHTSPEFAMKYLLAEGADNIFQLSYCFRDEPHSSIHRDQFLMLEWYRTYATYHDIMNDVENLIYFLAKKSGTQGPQGPQVPQAPEKRTKAPKDSPSTLLSKSSLGLLQSNDRPFFKRKTMNEIFKEILDINLSDYLDFTDLYTLIKNHYQHISLPQINDLNFKEKWRWDDLFFLLFLNEVEPKLVNYGPLIIYEYPSPLKALAQVSPQNSKVCFRFEAYINGIELCNGYQELLDPEEQEQRARESLDTRKDLYNHELPMPKTLIEALKKGIPPTSGVALGVERLMALFNFEDQFQNIFFPDQ